MAQLEGTYPIRMDGETIGTLTIGQDGLMTVFSADCRDDGDLIRLSVFDEMGSSGYLGVMLPDNGRLSLVKRLSRAGLRTFPETVSYAGIQQEDVTTEETTELPDVVPQPESVTEQKKEPNPTAETEACETDLIWKMQPNPWSLFSEPKIKAALRSVRGALTATEEGHVLLAVPMSLDGVMLPERIAEAGETREIDGMQYVVFRL